MTVETANNGQRPWNAYLKEDFVASIVVFLVALPLCIGIAVAVGVPAERALLTGIIGGVIVGVFAGSPLQVSGPAAGLFVTVAELIRQGRKDYVDTIPGVEKLGEQAKIAAESSSEAVTFSMMVLGTSVFLAGLIQIAAGQLKLGQWFRAVSPAVIKGMLAGIGVLILFSQFHVMLDHKAKWGEKDAHGGLEYMLTIPDAVVKVFDRDSAQDKHTGKSNGHASGEKEDGTKTLKDSKEKLSKTEKPASKEGVSDGKSNAENQKLQVEKMNHHIAAIIGVITISIILLWSWCAPKKVKLIPAALVAIVVVSLVAFFYGWTGGSEADNAVKTIQVAGDLSKSVTLPTDPNWFMLLVHPTVLNGALVIALIASAETLLCATAVDQMHTGPRTKYDQELSAQGVGNAFCGLIGVLPMTGVIVRSSANVEAGAKTRVSTILHGVWLLVFVAMIPFVLSYIPKSALGALLVYTGIKLVNFKQIRQLWNTSRSEFAIYLITVIVIVGEDLLMGVVVGIVLSTVKLLHRFSHLEIEKIEEGEGVVRLKMEGAATFLRLPLIAAELEKVTDSCELHVDFEHVSYVDHACLDLLMTWAEQHKDQGGKLVIDWDKLHARFRTSPKESVELAKRSRRSLEADPSKSMV